MKHRFYLTLQRLLCCSVSVWLIHKRTHTHTQIKNTHWKKYRWHHRHFTYDWHTPIYAQTAAARLQNVNTRLSPPHPPTHTPVHTHGSLPHAYSTDVEWKLASVQRCHFPVWRHACALLTFTGGFLLLLFTFLPWSATAAFLVLMVRCQAARSWHQDDVWALARSSGSCIKHFN